MLGLTLYTGMNAHRRKGTTWQMWGPTIFCGMAGILVMADLTRHVLQDTGVWPAGAWPGSSEYEPGCPTENISCLSAVGWIFTIVCTYTGFTFLVVGSMWNANICDKLSNFREKWNELRDGAEDDDEDEDDEDAVHAGAVVSN